MPRAKKPKYTFTVELLVAGQPTRNNRVYPQEIIDKLVEQINTKPITVEEVSPLERKLKQVPVCYSWPEHAMATSTGAECVDGKLLVNFEAKANKYGTLLKKCIDAGDVNYVPVGIGDVDDKGVITDYTISYIALDAGTHAEN